MSIPKMTTDLAVIQKLSDLPNSTDGLTAAQLKAKFDEAPLAIQKWLNENLVPSLTAENIPFTATSEINAGNLAEAIQDVHTQVKDASSGSIVNGSVTTAKLSPELLERVYGGRPWVGLDIPGSAQNPNADFPIGQIWLRPAFTVVNAAGESWVTSGCTTAAAENRLTVTGNNTVQTVTAVQAMTGIGQDGDRVYVLLGIENKDSEISALTVSLNGNEEQDASAGVFSGTLAGGALTVQLSATWPSTSLAGGSFDVVNYAVVNIDRILRQTPGAAEMADWASYLGGLLPLAAHRSGRELYIQTGAGVWENFDHFDTIHPGELIYGGANNRVEKLAVGAEKSMLQMIGGKPEWMPMDNVAESGSLMRVMKGSYTGDATATRTISLPVSPLFLYLFPQGVTSAADPATMLTDGVTQTAYRNVQVKSLSTGNYSTIPVSSTVTLNGNTLELKATTTENYNEASDGKNYFGNTSGVTYNWIAMY